VRTYNNICNGAWAAIRTLKSKGREVAAFVLTHEQRHIMLTADAPYGPYQRGIDGDPDTLFGVPVLVAGPGWSCPGNLEDLRDIQ